VLGFGLPSASSLSLALFIFLKLFDPGLGRFINGFGWLSFLNFFISFSLA
jgi:hypothetical protein